MTMVVQGVSNWKESQLNNGDDIDYVDNDNDDIDDLDDVDKVDEKVDNDVDDDGDEEEVESGKWQWSLSQAGLCRDQSCNWRLSL